MIDRVVTIWKKTKKLYASLKQKDAQIRKYKSCNT